jgi:beta-lactamase class A
MTTSELGVTVDRLLARVDGTAGVIAWRTGDPTPLLARHADRPFALASVVKLPLMLQVLRLAAAGRLDLGERLPLGEDDRVPGSGVLHLLDAGLAPTVRDLLRLAMVVSDNAATDRLFALVPPADVEGAMRALGYTSLRVPHTIMQMLRSCGSLEPGAGYGDLRAHFHDGARERPADPDGASPERGDRASPLDVARMLVDLVAGRVLTGPWRALALEILADCQTNGRLPARLPEGTRVAHKTGTLYARTNDAGIVYGAAGPFVLVVLQEGERDERRASGVLAEVARAVFDHVEASGAASPGPPRPA